MARKATYAKITTPNKKRKGVHKKKASKGQTGYKKKYRGQGK